MKKEKKKKKGKKGGKGEKKEKKREKRKKGDFFLWNHVTHSKAGTKKFGRVERSAAERAGRIFSEKLGNF